MSTIDPELTIAGALVIGSIASAWLTRGNRERDQKISRLEGEVRGLRHVVIEIIRGERHTA